MKLHSSDSWDQVKLLGLCVPMKGLTELKKCTYFKYINFAIVFTVSFLCHSCIQVFLHHFCGNKGCLSIWSSFSKSFSTSFYKHKQDAKGRSRGIHLVDTREVNINGNYSL